MASGVLMMKRRPTTFQTILLGFVAGILAGAVLLSLPVASNAGAWTPFIESLFTSTSAICVTGLVVRDTGSYWSGFGQAVILLLIQIGGLGVVTIAASFAMVSGRRISLMQRSTMQSAISAPQVGGIVRLTLFILKGTLMIELIGAVVMLPVFLETYGAKGAWMAVFHSVSAFCNAGFDILGGEGRIYPSLTAYCDDVLVNSTIMLLIFIGGIGFLTWDDVRRNGMRFRRYRMQSKVVLVTSSFLILLPAVLFFLVDFRDLPLKSRILASLFQSVSPRTAGYNTVDLSMMGEVSRAVVIVLMLIGGSPGSTAGGVKTTTFAVLVSNALATFRRREDVNLYGRRIDGNAVKTAATIMTMYLVLFFGGASFICLKEGLPFSKCLFETASAIGTVGLTLGITPGLGIASQLVLVFLMFFGRVGGLTIIYAALSDRRTGGSSLPLEGITIG